MRSIIVIAVATFKGGIRDRLLQGLIFAGFLLIASTGVFSSFSMRQPLEVAINYCLSATHILSIIMTLFLGLNLLSQEIESKENHFILTQPIPRSSYVLGKFTGLFLIIFAIIIILGIFSALGVSLECFAMHDFNVSWVNFCSALMGILFSCSILGSVIVLFTSVATSGVFPFLMSFAVYAAGENTAAVKRYITSGMAGEHISHISRLFIDIIYYVLPNFALFDFKAYAIYPLHLPGKLLSASAGYGIAYILLCLFFAVILFEKRDIS